MFESHITVTGIGRDKFRALCKKLRTTAICISDDTGSHLSRQLMTRRFHNTDDYQLAIDETFQLACKFDNVIRRKVEYILGRATVIPPNLPIKYYEYHLKYEVPSDRLSYFKDVVESLGCHTAKNVFKQSVVRYTNPTRFVTCRSEDRMKKVILALTEFKACGRMQEIVVFDDNDTIDSKWVCDCPLKVNNYVGNNELRKNMES